MELPAGSIDGAPADDLSSVFGTQLALGVEVGVKPIPALFVGALATASFGGAAGARNAMCVDLGITCSTRSFRLAGEVLWHMLPGASADPWLGYGLGYEWAALSETGGRRDGGLAYRGLTFADLSWGVDFRLGSAIGVGPFFDATMGTYSIVTEDSGVATTSSDVNPKALHVWFTSGLRGVLLP